MFCHVACRKLPLLFSYGAENFDNIDTKQLYFNCILRSQILNTPQLLHNWDLNFN